MKAAVPSAVIASLKVAQSAYAAPAFQSGFSQGVEDAGFPNGGPIGSGVYINRTGNGFDHHSDAFNEGYTRGWCVAKGYNATLYPHSNNLISDFRCRDVLCMSLIFSLEDNKRWR